LRQISESGLPLIIPDTETYAGWITLPAEATGLHAYLGAPIRVGTEIVGLRATAPGFFRQIHAERLQAFADQAAVAIQNARLYQKAQELAVLQERQRLARDLHDVVSQTPYSASIVAEMLPRLWARDLGAVRQGLEHLQQLTRGALAEMRTLLFELRPTALAEAELSELLRQLAEATAGRTHLAITVQMETQSALPPDVKIALYCIVQEALNNIVKHAQATNVILSLRRKRQSIELLVSDNGQGFDPGQVPPGHLGLTGMRERARAIGAAVKIRTAARQGRSVLAPEALQGLINRSAPLASSFDLTDRERTALTLMVEGLTNRQIAERMSISASTVKSYVSAILSKLNVASRTEAVALALQHKLVN
jgi:signal transduction histidine kinase/DNA-binding CsgD family transcriptional regulator